MVVLGTKSAEFHDGDPITDWHHDDRNELDKWVVISNRSPISLISDKSCRRDESYSPNFDDTGAVWLAWRPDLLPPS